MALFYACYRVDNSNDKQYEIVNASGQNKVKELIQKKYPGCKISWVFAPTSSSKPPGWFKG